MKISDLFVGTDVVSYNGCENMEISGVTGNSKAVKENFAFLCISGTKFDGHSFINEAADSGAVVAIVERKIDNCKIPYVLVENTRVAAAYIFSNYHKNPASSMRMIGVTGTNGKTSTTYMLSRIFEDAGFCTGIIGTIKNTYKGKDVDAGMTTPDPERLYALLADMRDSGVEVVLMEVSSHSLVLGRVAPICFDGVIYTNLTRDHLDFHKTMENYALAKEILFSQSKLAVFNVDNEYVRAAYNKKICESYSAAVDSDADFRAVDVEYDSMKGIAYTIKRRSSDNLYIKCKIPGEFSVYNTLCSVALALELGIDEKTVVRAIGEIEGVPGRIERITPSDFPFTVIIDYAHTPDALEKLLDSVLKTKNPNQKVTVLFGCGGDRDKTKRPIMGKIATELADFSIITSDNCRTEDPNSIIEDILVGIDKTKSYIVIPDRREAIKYAVMNAQDDEIILIAGKGHENYEIRKDGKHPFSEKEEVEKSIKLRYNNR